VLSGVVERGLKVGFPYNGQGVPLGDFVPLHPLRVPAVDLVRDTASAVSSVSRLLEEVRASVTHVSLVHSSAGQIAWITGVDAESVPTKIGGWIFDLRGNFQLTCGGAERIDASASRLVVFEGRSSPYVLAAPAPGATAVPTPPSGLFVERVIEPGEYAAIDRFRHSQSASDATMSALANAGAVDCRR